jgi:hypothetical protein
MSIRYVVHIICPAEQCSNVEASGVVKWLGMQDGASLADVWVLRVHHDSIKRNSPVSNLSADYPALLL